MPTLNDRKRDAAAMPALKGSHSALLTLLVVLGVGGFLLLRQPSKTNRMGAIGNPVIQTVSRTIRVVDPHVRVFAAGTNLSVEDASNGSVRRAGAASDSLEADHK